MAGDGIVYRHAELLPTETGEHLRQPVSREIRGGGQDAAKDFPTFVNRPVSPEAGEYKRVIVRPHRAEVITDRIVASLAGREGPYPPAAEHVIRHEASDRFPGVFFRGDTRPEDL